MVRIVSSFILFSPAKMNSNDVDVVLPDYEEAMSEVREPCVALHSFHIMHSNSMKVIIHWKITQRGQSAARPPLTKRPKKRAVNTHESEVG